MLSVLSASDNPASPESIMKKKNKKIFSKSIDINYYICYNKVSKEIRRTKIMELETKLELINFGISQNLDGKTFKNIQEIEDLVSRRLNKKVKVNELFELYGMKVVLSVWTKRNSNGLYVLSSMLVKIDTDEDVE